MIAYLSNTPEIMSSDTETFIEVVATIVLGLLALAAYGAISEKVEQFFEKRKKK